MNSIPEKIKFSNLESRLTFDCVTNLTVSGDNISSLSFYYKSTDGNMKVTFKDNIEKTIDEFIDLIKGRVYGTIMIEKYKNAKDALTYLISDDSSYKIGQSKEPKKRLRGLKTANPKAILIKETPYIPEKYLHKIFDDKKVGGEWYNLDYNDMRVLYALFNSETQLQADMLMRFFYKRMKEYDKVEKAKRIQKIETKEYLKEFWSEKIPFGKYKNLKFSQMVNYDQISYLKWMYKQDFVKEDFKFKIKLYLEYMGKM